MGGTNPYIDEPEYSLPTTTYQMVVRAEGQEVSIDVDPTKIPYERDGLPGSVLEIALGHGIDIDHACGGVVACSTCHVIVREGLETCNESSEAEEDQLDNAPGLTPQSRLACQCVPDGTQKVVVEVPEWNRNLVSEDHH